MTKRNSHIFFVSLLIASCFATQFCFAQDPNFSQFTASPLSISPALTGNGESSWRAMSNIRNQWIGIGSTYRTKSLSIDGKLLNNDFDDYLGVGGMLMLDDAMDGIYKSTYFSLNAAYHLTLDDKGNGIAAGIGWIYNSTMIDFSQLSFSQQLSSAGFNRALPTGEQSLSSVPNFSSFCAGIMYTYSMDNTFANFGIAGYRFMKSKRSVLDDASQYDDPRYDIHADFGTDLNNSINLSVSGLCSVQNGKLTSTIGANIGFLPAEETENSPLRIFNAGLFYRAGDAIIPTVGYIYNGFQIGLSYDVYISNIKSASVDPKTIELSLIFRKYNSNNIKKGRYHSPI